MVQILHLPLVADNGPYTTLEEDEVAKFLFPFALPANAANVELCPDGWNCHAFGKWYLSGENSRTKIVSEIVALLPQAGDTGTVSGFVRIEGQTTPVAGAEVSLCRLISEDTQLFCDTVLATTTSGNDGRYQFSSLPECSPCRVTASKAATIVFFGLINLLGG